MVAIPKNSGAIKICVDMKPLKSSVLRETQGQGPKCSVNWTRTWDLSHWQKSRDCWPLPSLSKADSSLTNSPVKSRAHQSISKNWWRKSCASDGWCSCLWHGQARTWPTTGSKNKSSRSNTQTWICMIITQIPRTHHRCNRNLCRSWEELSHCGDAGTNRDTRVDGIANQSGKLTQNLAELTQPLRDPFARTMRGAEDR